MISSIKSGATRCSLHRTQACRLTSRQLLRSGKAVSSPSNAVSTSSSAPRAAISSVPFHPRSACLLRVAAEAATASPISDSGISKAAANIIEYALNFARVSETYEVHSWMLLLGLLKQEDCRAAKILKDMGLDDLYGAWHEVLWALNVSNGLDPRSPLPEVRFQDRAARVLTGSTNFAMWGGRDKVQTEDVLMALAAGDVLTGLFPDLGLTFDHVRKAAAKHGCKYELPDDDASQQKADAEEEENFL